MTSLMDTETAESLDVVMTRLGEKAREAAANMAAASGEARTKALRVAASEIRDRKRTILDAAEADVEAATTNGMAPAMLDRLKLDPVRLESIATSLEAVAAQPDPLGRTLAKWERPNGLKIARVSVPIGVIGIIYESRPNVTADAGALCIKSGNAAILRGGSESVAASRSLVACLHDGLRAAGLPPATVQMVPTTDRAAVGQMLTMTKYIDLIVPRGGKSLTERVAKESRIPLLMHLEGLNHVYVHAAADLEKARAVVLNSKMRRVSVCGAAETLLIDRAALDTLLQPLLDDLIEAGCQVRGDAEIQARDTRVVPATEADWSTEYLAAIISAKVVGGVDEAIAHIARYGSHHTDSIVTENKAIAERFLNAVDSGIVLWNASTQFADGGEFGFGAEIGIATGKLHARGPVGAEQLTTFKYKVRGNGTTRP